MTEPVAAVPVAAAPVVPKHQADKPHGSASGTSKPGTTKPGSSKPGTDKPVTTKIGETKIGEMAIGDRAFGGRGSAGQKRSLFQLIADVPTLVTDLVKGEIDQLKAEMIVKLKALGIGGGILAVAAVILLYMIGVLLTAAVLGLAEVMAPWLAALLVALVLLIIAAIVGFIGYRKLKAGIPPVPKETIASVKHDINTIKGMGK